MSQTRQPIDAAQHGPAGSSRPAVYALILLLPLLPLNAGCLTTLALTAVSKSGVADEHMGPVKDTAKEASDAARGAAEQVAEAAQDTFESWGEDFGD